MEEEGEQAQPDAEEAEEDRITTLPEALRLQILTLLPLKSAIRTGALSTQWRALWSRSFLLCPRGHPPPPRHRVTISDHDIFCLVAACPLLRTLDLRYCKGLCSGDFPAGANLKSVTVAECERLADVLINKATGLRSFRYSGGYLAADQIPTTIDDLYLFFGGSARRNCSGAITYHADGKLCKLRRSCLDALIDVCNLTVLTLCSSALRRVSGKARAKSIDGNAAVCKLQNLREGQLLMFAMFNENLNDITVFLMTCCSPRLERLFVQLPTRSGQYKPEEEPSDSEEDGSEDDELEEELYEGHECDKLHAWEKHLCYEEESEEDQSEQDESDEDGSEENHSKVNESEEVGSEENRSKLDESEDDGSEEDELEEELSEGHTSEDDLSEGEEYGEDQSAVEEGSEEPVEEPLGDGCENLFFSR